MSTEELEESTYRGEPVELYLFEYGGAQDFPRLAYTDAAFDIETMVGDRGLIDFKAEYIERDEISVTETLDKTNLKIRVDESSDISDLFRVYPPAEVVSVTIFRCHWDEETGETTEPAAIWVGRVLSCSRESSVAELNCETVITSFRRTGLRRHYQYLCPHVLYGSSCGANQKDHTITREIVDSSPRSITVSGEVSDQYLGGIVTWEVSDKPKERRTILKKEYKSDSDETVLTVAGNPDSVYDGLEVELSKGCKHTLEDCREVFNNAPNFGGMPYIPTKNPHGTTSIYN